MARIFNPKLGMYEDIPEEGQPKKPPMSPYMDATNPYANFQSTFAPKTDVGASDIASNLMGGYGNISYQPKSAQSYIPQETLSQLGKVTGGLANYQPEKINVGRVESMPVEYYQKQVEDLSQPLAKQYETSRALTRGDLAARGTIYDSEAYDPRVQGSLGSLDKNYIEQLGNITRGVQLQRMQQEQQNAQDYANKSYDEATGRRTLGLQGLSTAGSVLPGVAGMYGELGGKEQERAITTALQNKGLDANTINSLLGYGADRYKTEAGLYGDIYKTDIGYNQSMIEDARAREEARRKQILDLLQLPGYTEQPQGPLWEALGQELGYSKPELTGQSSPPPTPPAFLPPPRGPDSQWYYGPTEQIY
mgnify:CR=1 FL=1